MPKDAISKRLKDTISEMRSGQDMLDGGSPAWLYADIEPPVSMFERFYLDPKKPRDQRFLLVLLNYILFYKGKAGAPKKWWRKPSQLKADVAAVKRRHPGRKSVRAIAGALVEDEDKKFGGRYRNMTADSLRKIISQTGK
jgi:hypothetical protein